MIRLGSFLLFCLAALYFARFCILVMATEVTPGSLLLLSFTDPIMMLAPLINQGVTWFWPSYLSDLASNVSLFNAAHSLSSGTLQAVMGAMLGCFMLASGCLIADHFIGVALKGTIIILTGINRLLGSLLWHRFSRTGAVVNPTPWGASPQSSLVMNASQTLHIPSMPQLDLSLQNVPAYHGQMRDVTILFCDIRGYTSMVEKSPPQLVIHQLNEYFSVMTQVIYHHQGRLDKYMGDGLMAFFEPTDGTLTSSAINGVRAALAMEQALVHLNKRWQSQGLPALDIGIGINSGEVFIGNIGSQMKMDFTIIGDNVNLAARLEPMTKTYKARIIMSEATRECVAHHIESIDLGLVQVRGKEHGVRIFSVKGIKSQPTALLGDTNAQSCPFRTAMRKASLSLHQRKQTAKQARFPNRHAI